MKILYYNIRKVFLLILFVFALIIGVFVSCKIRWSIEITKKSICNSNIAQISLAIQNYHTSHGTLPPAYARDGGNMPIYSWRVLLAKTISHGFEDGDVRFDWEGSWNSSHNLVFEDCWWARYYRCPNQEEMPSHDSHYFVVVGPGTAFPEDGVTSWEDFADGRENTVLFVEVANSGVHWMEPRELNFETLAIQGEASPGIGISSDDPGGPALRFADGRTYRIRKPIPADILRALFTIAGGEAIDREELVAQGYLGW